ncbi:hypothetical protein B0A52_05709 [Exophiala mesophila]|uniref:Isotrichodermin C-15 hydroxylase n=1 Tax=Exophiala mesophila TaxID=212818 RepID=A0A438N2K2_EXOME|nr:hypothetical protein B0A52_05709 [Exophiala mesophila]
MTIHILTGLAILAICRAVFLIYSRLYISPLKVIPGPLLEAVTSIPHDLACIKGVNHEYLEKLHDKYGPIVRISPTEVSFIDSSIWRDVYGFRKNDAECEKSDVIDRVNGVTGILDANRMDHRRYRRLLSHAFSEQSLRQQEDRLQHHVDMLVRGLTQGSKDGPLDISQWLQWTTFDIMGDLAFGESFDSLGTKQTHPWQKFLLDNIAGGMYIGIIQRWGLGRVAALCTPSSLIQAMRDFYDMSSTRIDRRIAMGKERGDFLDHILKHELVGDDEKGQVKGMRVEELKSTASDIAIAGSETTATLLTGLVYFLLMNPTVLEKVQEEIDGFEAEEQITVASTAKLPYFSAVLEEGLRIFIPSPVISARTIPTAGLVVGGYLLPVGTRVFAAHHIAYRSSLHFARPKEFVPERWLANRPEEFASDNASGIFQPFAAGPRNCIGSNLAKAEMRLILATLLWRFEMNKPSADQQGGQDWDGWFQRLKVYFLWHKPPLMVEMKPRRNAG